MQFNLISFFLVHDVEVSDLFIESNCIFFNVIVLVIGLSNKKTKKAKGIDAIMHEVNQSYLSPASKDKLFSSFCLLYCARLKMWKLLYIILSA